MFDLGIQELVVIFVVALIVLGPKKLPELGKTLGKGLLELKKAMEGIKEQMSEETEGSHSPSDTAPLEEEKKEEGNPHPDLPPQGHTSHERNESESAAPSDPGRGELSPSSGAAGQERKGDTVNGG